MSRGSGGVAVALASVTIAAIGLSAPAGAGGERGSETVLANHCFAIQAIASGRYVESTDGAYAARAPGAERAERFWFKPTSLDPTYMLSDRQGRLMAGEGRYGHGDDDPRAGGGVGRGLLGPRGVRPRPRAPQPRAG